MVAVGGAVRLNQLTLNQQFSLALSESLITKPFFTIMFLFFSFRAGGERVKRNSLLLTISYSGNKRNEMCL